MVMGDGQRMAHGLVDGVTHRVNVAEEKEYCTRYCTFYSVRYRYSTGTVPGTGTSKN